MVLLQKEKVLQEIVQLIGEDALPDSEKIVLRTTKLIPETSFQDTTSIILYDVIFDDIEF